LDFSTIFTLSGNKFPDYNFTMLKIAFSPIYKYELPEGHRFPMLKYELIPEQLLYEGTITEANFFHPTPLSDDIINLTHSPAYWHRLKNLELTPKEIRKIGFPMSQRLIDRCITIANGTVQCAHYAMQSGVALNVAGGTHHSFTDRGEGFCLLNDVAIAANYLIDKCLCKRILVVDLDVHQGNGTAQIFRNSKNKWKNAPNTEGGVFTFSMHGENNYPLQKEQSDLDIGLPDGTDDTFYLKILKENLSLLIDTVQPEFIFFNAGVDVLETDKLGRLKLTLAGCRERDKIVFNLCKKHKIPIAVSMGGGYSAKIATIVEAHANTFRLAQEIFF
jgi:acetoin utilization deacetylase AcuC-like enzyme